MLVKLREPPRRLCMNGQLRFVTSCTAADPNCIIFAYNLCSNSVAFYVLRHKKWSPLFTFNNSNNTRRPVEAIFYQGHFYAADNHGVVRRLLFDIEDNSYEEEVVSVDIGGTTPHRYLVESPSSSSLMMVVRRFHLQTGEMKTKSFEIFKLDWRNGKWEEVNSLGDQALFLSHHDSKLVSHYPGYSLNSFYFRKNTIFFVDDLFAHWNSGSCDFGLYDLGDRMVRPLNIYSLYTDSPYCGWFQPAP
ncbi:uncharacterized protein LOC132294150 [Cornus florida]|uniref:uncharacterized protein LOC132294150 n=1 Tax=Cornus florida TaxID=4283 RepID=UPI00289ECA4C|nr:uncharacterized protein LOC132294150 [Cornus florida]